MLDVVGDIHGHSDALEALPQRLGYRNSSGAWRHTDRQMVFVGDYIDRGPKQLEAVDLVRRMIDAGSAMAMMGNHKLNAIAFATERQDGMGDYLRSHAEKNVASMPPFSALLVKAAICIGNLWARS